MRLPDLEAKRTELLKALSQLGDMRSGSLSVRYQKCGKHPCVCHEPNHPGHGPIYSFSSVVDGKTKIRNYKEGAELNKLLRELEDYERFRELSRELIAVSDKISELRPVEAWAGEKEEQELKKKLQKRFAKRYRKKLIVS
jgi:hypothetical protein